MNAGRPAGRRTAGEAVPERTPDGRARRVGGDAAGNGANERPDATAAGVQGAAADEDAGDQR